MKIGVLTFHHAKQSYGAILQSYATLEAIKKTGHIAELINYENSYEQKNLKNSNATLKLKVKIFINWFARTYIFGGYRNPYLKKKNIDKLYTDITPLIKSQNELDKLVYDILIIGSDQVWNPEITGGVDKTFLLSFGSAQKRISYASSMGSHVLNEPEAEIYRECLNRFDAISVRESFAAEQLSKLLKREVVTVLDPTLLLNAEEWSKALGVNLHKNSEPYILTYFIGSNLESNWQDIQPYVEELKLPIYNIQTHNKKSKHTNKALYAMTASEMLEAIANASLIITDSFHGTAFSINFRKDFISIPNRKNPLRVQNLLHMFKLEYRIKPVSSEVNKHIEYQEPCLILEEQRKQSFDWLVQSIG